MSCPNWRELAAHRATHSGEEPEGYREALAHLDGCKECWDEALAADPSLLFRRMTAPALEISEEAEILAVQQAVAAMRTASRLEKAAPRRSALERRWKSWAAAAALAATVGGFGSWYGLSRPGEAVSEPLGVPGAGFAVPAGQIESPEGAYSQVKEFGATDGDDVVVSMIYGQGLEV